MNTIKLLIVSIAATIPGISSAAAVLIDFEGFANGTVITDQYPGVSFSANAGFENTVSTQPGIGFGDNFICTAAVGGIPNCTEETLVTFSTPVSNLSFYQVGDNASGVVAFVDVFVNDLLAGTVDILGDNSFNVPNLVDLTGFSDITSIRIHGITDPGGLGWDNFSFGAAIPLPGALWFFGSGVLWLAGRARLRK